MSDLKEGDGKKNHSDVDSESLMARYLSQGASSSPTLQPTLSRTQKSKLLACRKHFDVLKRRYYLGW
jgi:hypothetical protein